MARVHNDPRYFAVFLLFRPIVHLLACERFIFTGASELAEKNRLYPFGREHSRKVFDV